MKNFFKLLKTSRKRKNHISKAVVKVKLNKLISEDAVIIVDYSRDEETIMKHNGYSIDTNIDFPRDCVVSNEKVPLAIRLFFFPGNNVNIANISPKMKESGYRPSNFRELLIFGETYPYLQHMFPVFALGAVFPDHNVFRFKIPYLYVSKYHKERELAFKDIGRYSFRQYENVCFLAVKERGK